MRLDVAGDILSLVERAEESIKEDEAKRVTERLLAAKFDFNDFLAQFKMMNNMGSMGAVMKMLPGAFRHSFAILIFSIDDTCCCTAPMLATAQLQKSRTAAVSQALYTMSDLDRQHMTRQHQQHDLARTRLGRGLFETLYTSAGMAAITDKQMAQAEAQFKKFESMINSMTPVLIPYSAGCQGWV